MALFTLLSVILAVASLTVAQYPPEKEWGYQSKPYPPDTYPPAEPYPPGPPVPEPYPPPVEPYPPEPYPPEGYPPQPDDWSYGEEPTWKLRLLVEERVKAQKEKLEDIKQFRQMALRSVEKISTMSAAWCRSKYSVVSLLYKIY